MNRSREELNAVHKEMADLQPEDVACPPETADAGDEGPIRIKASDVTMEELEWIWPNRIPKGKLTVLAGDPGVGKSVLHVAIATHITRGSNWPVDRVQAPRGSVLILTAEDDLKDTYIPRLAAAGADLEKVEFLTMYRVSDPEHGLYERMLNLKQDVSAIEAVVRDMGDCRAVLIDPISAYLGGDVDSHRDTEVRSILAPVANMAQQTGATVIGIMHLSKGQGKAMYRAIGSIAFTAAARMVWAITKDHEDPERRLMLPVKMNLAREAGGLAYRIEQASVEGLDTMHPVLAWEPNPVDVDIEAALAPPPVDRQAPRREAMAWLEDQLEHSPVPVTELKEQADIDGHAWRTIERAKKDLGIKSKPSGFGGPHRWGFAGQFQSAPQPVSTDVPQTGGGLCETVATKGNGVNSSAETANFGVPSPHGGLTPELAKIVQEGLALARSRFGVQVGAEELLAGWTPADLTDPQLMTPESLAAHAQMLKESECS